MADLVYPGKAPVATLNSGAMPANTNMVIYKGDYVELFVTLTDNAGAPISLTGMTPKAVLKQAYGSTVVAEFTCEETATVGVVRIYLPSAKSILLESDSYIWDFEIANASGDSRTYLTGDVSVSPGVTD